MAPRARTIGTTSRVDSDALVVTVQDTGKELVLHPVTAYVWQHADGATSVADLVALIHRDLHLEVSESLLWTSVDLLADNGLLEDRVAPPAGDTSPAPGGELADFDRTLSRRALLTRVGVAGSAAVAAGLAFPASAAANGEAPEFAGGLPACRTEEASTKASLTEAQAQNAELETKLSQATADEQLAKNGESSCKSEVSQEQASKEQQSKEQQGKQQEQERKQQAEQESKQAEQESKKQAAEEQQKEVNQKQQAAEQQSKEELAKTAS